jgi:hypothetical protein
MNDNQKWLERVNRECTGNSFEADLDELSMFRAVAKTIVGDAGKSLEETWALWELDSASPQIRENFHLLRQRLSYLFRFCEGKV